MTLCNQCGSPMVPSEDALVPALECSNPECRRLIPLPGPKARTRKAGRAELNRALRAARRQEMRRAASAE